MTDRSPPLSPDLTDTTRILPRMNLTRHSSLAVAALALTGVIHAQNVETIQKSPTSSLRTLDVGADRRIVNDAPAAAEAPDEEILPKLNGITLLELLEGGRTAELDRVPPSLTATLEDFVGKPLRTPTLTLIKTAVSNSYERATGELVRALIPEQDVTSGVLTVHVVRGKVGELSVEGNRWFRDEIYLRNLSLTPGGPVDNAALFEDMDWLNRNPYRSVHAVYRPGDGFGATDIVLRPAENRPWTVFGGYDNFGTDLLGRDRWFFGAQHGNIFGTDSRFVYQYFSDSEFENFSGHFASITTPLPWRHELTIGAFYSESQAENVAGVSTLDLDGESYQTTLDYVVPEMKWRGWETEWVYGFDFKSSNSNLEFGLEDVFDTTTQIFQFRAGWRAEKHDRLGHTGLSSHIAFSFGEWSNGHSDDAFGASRGGAGTDYVYWRSDLDRTWDLGESGWTLETGGRLQLSSSNLLASEQLGLSGSTGVRGFEESAVRGDQAVLARFQLNAPPVTLQQLPGGAGAQPFAFFDWGWGRGVDPAPGEGDVSLSSAGLGLRAALARNAFVDASYGWQLGQSGFEDDEESGRFLIQATIRW